METQRSARHGPETGPKSRLKEVLMLACREPSINKYTSGTALYEYNSLKRSEKMLIGMQNKAVGTCDIENGYPVLQQTLRLINEEIKSIERKSVIYVSHDL